MKMKMKASVCALTLILGLCLGGCTILPGGFSAGPKQPETDNAVEIVTNFLTAFQSGDYAMAKTYMKEGNTLIHVLSATEGESIPELDEVYRRFCAQMSDLTFSVTEESESRSDDIVRVTARNRDYGSAIYGAMLDALQNQCESGGSAFADFAGWMGRGVAEAADGTEDSAHAIVTKRNSAYIVNHQGYGDEQFLNLVTGGFYDFADLTMTTCTSETDDIQYTDYIAAQGDRVIASLMESAVPLEDSGMTEGDVVQLQEYYRSLSENQKGIYNGVYIRDGYLVYATGIDYETANDVALVNAGLVSGEFQGDFDASYLSLTATIRSFESDGLTCVTVPQYEMKR